MVIHVATRFYRVLPDQPVTAFVEVGEGQIGGMSFSWEKQNPTPSDDGGVVVPIPGGPSALRGTLLKAVVVVKDIDPATNNTSVRVTLAGGEAAPPFDFEQAADQDLGLVTYHLTFAFL